MKALQILVLASFFGVLVAVSFELPHRGSLTSPANRDVSAAGTPVAGSYYVREAYEDAHTDNMVTVTLGDYRGFDTLGETVVVFAAGAASILILRRRQKR